MASVVDTLVTRFVGDSSSHEAAVGRINMANAGLVTSMSAAIAGVAVAGAAAVAIWYKINEAMIRAGASAFQQFAQYDALAKSLAVTLTLWRAAARKSSGGL